MRILIYLSFFLFPQFCLAQFVEKSSYFIPSTKSINAESSLHEFQLERSISSISIGISDQNSFEGSFISTRSDTFFLTHDEHGASFGKKYSNLLIFPEPIRSFEFHYFSIRDSVEVYFISDKSDELFKPLISPNNIKPSSGNFELPEMIDQSVWREGLSAPNFDRIIHVVHSVIIHHSATSNTVTDYTTAIRNIYLYHTEVRGWSDIGYNYLIAGNGDIYKGRDPGSNEQDLVMGAHFCSSNRGTMGICLLGTFTEIAPTDTAFASLEKLLVWKLGKDEMDALGQYAHPLNSELNVISGHRDGCATECPGEVMYERLGLMRDLVHNKILLVGIDLISNANLNNDDIHLFPNPVEHELSITSSKQIESISILTIGGKMIKDIIKPRNQIDLSNLKKGTYILLIKSKDQDYSRRIIKR